MYLYSTAETFLSKYDEIPGDEIVSLVSDLNQLVVGIADKCGEILPFGKDALGPPRDNDEFHFLSFLASVIGAPFVNFLRSKTHSEDPTIVQLAIQATLVHDLYGFIKRWPFLVPSQTDSFGSNFWKLYSSIHHKEMQAVAARWRALGTKHFRGGLKTDYEALASGSLEFIIDILRASGAQFNSSPQSSKEQLRGDLERLWRQAATIAEKTKESILSTDYKLIFVRPGDDFDDRIAKAQGEVKERSRILCPTELGLMRVTGNEKPGGGSGQLERSVISKATVIFEHEIEAMFA
ncbi:hypothetical protein DFH11DRAFT_1620197 [Phellopilus nigrolimitatus]|nr:hypothetical protein DFH11DRAFT_1620197 [Phellopilus nigrolimitatus]